MQVRTIFHKDLWLKIHVGPGISPLVDTKKILSI